jgi:hypothetical protein
MEPHLAARQIGVLIVPIVNPSMMMAAQANAVGHVRRTTRRPCISMVDLGPHRVDVTALGTTSSIA